MTNETELESEVTNTSLQDQQIGNENNEDGEYPMTKNPFLEDEEEKMGNDNVIHDYGNGDDDNDDNFIIQNEQQEQAPPLKKYSTNPFESRSHSDSSSSPSTPPPPQDNEFDNDVNNGIIENGISMNRHVEEMVPPTSPPPLPPPTPPITDDSLTNPFKSDPYTSPPRTNSTNAQVGATRANNDGTEIILDDITPSNSSDILQETILPPLPDHSPPPPPSSPNHFRKMQADIPQINETTVPSPSRNLPSLPNSKPPRPDNDGTRTLKKKKNKEKKKKPKKKKKSKKSSSSAATNNTAPIDSNNGSTTRSFKQQYSKIGVNLDDDNFHHNNVPYNISASLRPKSSPSSERISSLISFCVPRKNPEVAATPTELFSSSDVEMDEESGLNVIGKPPPDKRTQVPPRVNSINTGELNSARGEGTTIPQLLTKIRILNCLFVLLVFSFEGWAILGHIITLDIQRIILSIFLLFFTLLLIAFEMLRGMPTITATPADPSRVAMSSRLLDSQVGIRAKQVGNVLYKVVVSGDKSRHIRFFLQDNFGFLYSCLGRGIFLCVIGGLACGEGFLLMVILGFGFWLYGLWTISLHFRYPSLEKVYNMDYLYNGDEEEDNSVVTWSSITSSMGSSERSRLLSQTR